MALTSASAINGQAYPAELQRLANTALAPGVSGVIAPSDLLVRGLGASGVSVDAGAGIAANTYSSAGFRQSYLVANDGATSDAIMAVPAAGSTNPRTDYLILRVYDAQYAGQTDPTGKGCGLELVASLPTGHPYVPLAKIVQPAGNTAGIQQSMVTDLRVVANPRSVEVWRPIPSLATDDGTTLNNATTGEIFPNANGPQDIAVPSWAVRAQIECHWIGVLIPAGANPNGHMWVEYGPQVDSSHRESSTQQFSFDTPAAGATNDRDDWLVADDVYVPPDYRGTTQRFQPLAAYNSGYNTANGKVSVTSTSGMFMRVRFLEVADTGAL